jgi:MFS family permease
MVQTAGPSYVVEMSYPKYRAQLTGAYQAFFFMGTIVSTWLEYGLNYIDTSLSYPWRLPLAIQGLPSVIILCTVWFIPESPRWSVLFFLIRILLQNRCGSSVLIDSITTGMLVRAVKPKPRQCSSNTTETEIRMHWSPTWNWRKCLKSLSLMARIRDGGTLEHSSTRQLPDIEHFSSHASRGLANWTCRQRATISH